jgi:hypothetical protein
MALVLGVKWPPVMDRTPPSFEREENKIWQNFIDSYGDSYEFFHYNVRVGEDRFPDVKELDQYQKMTQDLALKKIDAVGFRAGVWDIIEVRRHAGPGTLGQLMTYETLWLAYSGPLKPYVLTIVTDYMDIDTQLAVRARAGNVVIV